MMKMRTLKKWTIYGVGLAASVAMIAMSSSRISSQKLKVKSYWVPKAKYIKAFSLEFDIQQIQEIKLRQKQQL